MIKKKRFLETLIFVFPAITGVLTIIAIMTYSYIFKFDTLEKDVIRLTELFSRVEFLSNDKHRIARGFDFTEDDFTAVNGKRDSNLGRYSGYRFHDEGLKKKQVGFNRELVKMSTLLRKHGIGFYLCRGTLLGAVREKYFIPHDQDVDLCVFASTTDYHSFRRLMENNDEYKIFSSFGDGTKENGFEVSMISKDIMNFIYPDIIGSTRVDIYFIYDDYEKDKSYVVTWYCKGFWLSFLPWREDKCYIYTEKFSLRKIEFLGNYYYAPHPVEKYLEDCYGKGWKIPKDYSYWEGLSKEFNGLEEGVRN